MVGLDIGHSTLKVVVTKGGKVEKKLAAPLPESTIVDGKIIDPISFVSVLSEMVSELKIKRERVGICLPLSELFFKKITFPIMDERELEEALEGSLSEHVSFSPKDIYWDFSVLGINPSDERFMDVLLVVSKKDYVDYSTFLVASSGLEPVIVDGLPFSCYNGIESLVEGTSRFMVLDVGHANTKVLVFENGSPIVAREFPSDVFVKEKDELEWAKNIVSQILKISKSFFSRPLNEEVEKGFIIGGYISDILLDGLREVLEISFIKPSIDGLDKDTPLFLTAYGISRRELSI